MIENYESLNRDETLAAARHLGDEQIAEFVEYERTHKNRKTVIEPLQRELVDISPVGQQYAAGLWFESVDEVQTVRHSQRIEQAIERGRLEVV